MREPTKDNDAGRILAAIVAGEGAMSVDEVMTAWNPPPRMGRYVRDWMRDFHAWGRRMGGDRGYVVSLLSDLSVGGYITRGADTHCRPKATDKGRALVNGWA